MVFGLDERIYILQGSCFSHSREYLNQQGVNSTLFFFLINSLGGLGGDNFMRTGTLAGQREA